MTDKVLTQESGFIHLVEPGDVILHGCRSGAMALHLAPMEYS